MVILYSFFIPVCWANLCLEYLWMSQCLFPERITHLILSMFFFLCVEEVSIVKSVAGS